MTGVDTPELRSETAEVLQAAKRVLAGVALCSLNVLDGAVTLPQFRMLAVLGDLGRARSAQVAGALGLDASTVIRLADRPAAAWREQELARILRQLLPAGRRHVTRALRQLVEAAGEGSGTISPTLVPMWADPARWPLWDAYQAVAVLYHAHYRAIPGLAAPMVIDGAVAGE